MNTTQQILTAFSLSYLHYDNLRERKFADWCLKYAKEFSISIRAMMCHDGLRNWYHDQWQVFVEQAFTAHYAQELSDPEADIDNILALMDLFLTYPDIILEIYPKPLLNMIKTESNGTIRQKRLEGARVSAE